MTFYVYIDESGDEGFSYKPPPDKRGTEWFILSAVVADSHHYRSVAAQYGAIKRAHKQPNWHFHFVKASHDDRVAFIDWISRSGTACMSTIVHKPSLTNRDAFTKPYALYFYAARILIERISWHCAHVAKTDFSATPDAHLLFSSRRGLTEVAIRKYIKLMSDKTDAALEIGPWLVSNSIDWSAINPNHIWVAPNKQYVGLQMADAVVSSIAKALELNNYNMTEHRYVKMLEPVLYKRNNTYRSYGLKFFPRFPASIETEPRFHWLKRFK